MAAYAGQAILHATIAAMVVEALLRVWRVGDPGGRLRLRWVVLLSPVLTAALVMFVPARSTAWFGVHRALFSGAHWDELRLGSLGIATVMTHVLAWIGVALYLRDAVPFVADRAGRRAPDEALPDDHPAVVRLHAQLFACAGGTGPAALPAVTVVASGTPVLLCSGIDRPRIVASTATVDSLTDEELRAALAHEVFHATSRDPLMGWWLMAARTLQCFNPAIQIVGRLAVVEIERRADLAVVGRGQARPLASAIQRLGAAPESRSDLVSSPDRTGLADRVRTRAYRHALADRCARILEAGASAGPGPSWWHLALAGATLTVILFFVV